MSSFPAAAIDLIALCRDAIAVFPSECQFRSPKGHPQGKPSNPNQNSEIPSQTSPILLPRLWDFHPNGLYRTTELSTSFKMLTL